MLEIMSSLSKKVILIIFHNFEIIIRIHRTDINGRKIDLCIRQKHP